LGIGFTSLLWFLHWDLLWLSTTVLTHSNVVSARETSKHSSHCYSCQSQRARSGHSSALTKSWTTAFVAICHRYWCALWLAARPEIPSNEASCVYSWPVLCPVRGCSVALISWILPNVWLSVSTASYQGVTLINQRNWSSDKRKSAEPDAYCVPTLSIPMGKWSHVESWF